ncbi:MAG: hypothetical protein HYX61_12920 [Gammaproteobacteria bacterium]|jgi:uncharacterized protein YacL|nr:hypothetical protein [Gammaproteobacteria bacterium]
MTLQSDTHCSKCFSWKAVLVGAVVAFGLIFLFNLLTIGGGLAAYTRTEKGLETLVTITYLWTVVGSFLMLFIAGLVTSMILSHGQNTHAGHHILHGFVTWVLYILISIIFLSHLNETSIATVPQNFMSMSVTSDSVKVTATAQEAERNNATTSSSAEKLAEQKQAHKLGLATLASFFIFLVEAIACCFGAHVGIETCRRKC